MTRHTIVMLSWKSRTMCDIENATVEAWKSRLVLVREFCVDYRPKRKIRMAMEWTIEASKTMSRIHRGGIHSVAPSIPCIMPVYSEPCPKILPHRVLFRHNCRHQFHNLCTKSPCQGCCRKYFLLVLCPILPKRCQTSLELRICI